MKGGSPDQNRRLTMLAANLNSERPERDQINHVQTVEQFAAWQIAHTAKLREIENKRLARIQAFVNRSVQLRMRDGVAFNDACRWTLQAFNYAAGGFTKSDVKRALQELGWRSKGSSSPQGGDA